MNDSQVSPVTDVIELVPDKLYSVASTIRLDGNVSSYPANATGYTKGHCYLLKQGNDALLLDTGYTAHRRAIIASLRQLMTDGDELSIYPLRLNEYMSVCNVEMIAQTFRAKQCYSGNPDASLWVGFSRHVERPDDYVLKTSLVARRQEIDLGSKGERKLQAFQAPIRLIGTRWVMDPSTGTLFSSDSFTHQWSKTTHGPWVIDHADDVAAMPHIRSFLLNTRYWWLEGGKTEELCAKIDAVRRDYSIERIAPGYGKITEGREAVDLQFDRLIEALRSLDRSVMPSAYVDRDLVR
jgi:flavorubredoxin